MLDEILTSDLDQHDDNGVKHGIIASHTDSTDLGRKNLSSVLERVSKCHVEDSAKHLPWQRTCS